MTHFFALLALAVPHLDQHGDPLPPGAVARFGTVRYRVGHARIRNSHAISPDGKLLAAEDDDGIALWDIDTGRLTKRLPWRTWQGDMPRFGLCFSPDGKRLARLAGRVVAMWDLASAEEVFDIDFKQEGPFQGIAYLPGKDQLIITGRDQPRAWVLDARTGKIVRTIEFAMKYPLLVPKGKSILGFNENNWFVFDAETGKERSRFSTDVAFAAKVESFDVTADGSDAWQVGPDGLLRHFDAATGKKLEELAAPSGWVVDDQKVALAVSLDGSVVYLSGGELEIHRWDVAARKWLPPIKEAPAGILIPHPDRKRLLVIGNDGILRRYDLATRRELPSPDGFEHKVSAYPSPDGRRVIIDSGRPGLTSRLDLFETSGKRIWTLRLRDWGVPRWSPDGKRLACLGGRIVLRNVATGELVRVLDPLENSMFTGPPFFPPGGDRLIAPLNYGEAVVAFDLATGAVAERWEPDVSGFKEVSPDGRMLLYKDDNKGLRLFDLAAGRFRTDWLDPPPEDGHISAGVPAFSPDGSYLLTWVLEPQREVWRSRDSVAVLRNPRTGERRKSLELGLGGRFVCAFSPDGLWLAVGTRSAAVELYEVATGERIGKWEGHRDYISTLAFAGPGRVVTASGDLTVLLWDLSTKQRPAKPLWDALSGTDAKEAWRAVWALASDPNGPDLLRAKITAPAAPPAERVKQWIADLGADRFAVREAATKALQELGTQIEPELKAAREQAKSEEVRTRLDVLLAKINPDRTAADLVPARAVAALEAAGTPAARKLLAEWAAGPPGARLTMDAKAALGR
jgi:WD40 repeat protein